MQGTGLARIWAKALAAFAIGLAMTAAPAAHAAEIVATPPTGGATITAGTVSAVSVDVSAQGALSCLTSRSSAATALLDTQYSLVGGKAVPSGEPGAALPFYSNGQLSLQELGSCGVTWDAAPAPYRVEVAVAVAPDTPAGNYALPLGTQVRNTGAPGAGLADATPSSMRVRVEEPPQPPAPPAVLPPPRENFSVNLLPVRGQVLARYPRSETPVTVSEPIQVPVGTTVDAARGFVDLVSDRDGRGAAQRATFWNGRFGVSYSRVLVPRQAGARPSQAASAPITELSLTRSCPPRSQRATRGGRISAQSSRRRRRGVFGKGRGRFRTRGSYGAGTVRGTAWYTESRCDATVFEVTSGVVSVRDFVRSKTISLRRGQGYIALPHNPRKGGSTG